MLTALALYIASQVLVPGVVSDSTSHHFTVENHHYNMTDLKNATKIAPGDRTFAVYLPSLEDESKFVGVFKW